MNMFDTSFDVCVNGEIYHYGMYRDFEADGDNVKNWHYVWKEGEEKTVAPFSPYAWISEEDVVIWVKCGRPSRTDNGGRLFNPSTLIDYYGEYMRIN